MNDKQIFGGSILSLIGSFFTIVATIISANLLTGFLSKNDYGIYSLMLSLVGQLSILDFGMHNIVTRFVAKYNVKGEYEEKKAFLGSVFIIYIFLDILLIFIGIMIYQNVSIIFSHTLSGDEISISRKLIVIMGTNLALSLPGGVFEAYISANEKFIFTKSLYLLKIITRTLCVYLCVLIGINILVISIVDLLINIVFISINVFYCLFKLKFKATFNNIKAKRMTAIFSYSSLIFISNITDQINWKIDNVVIGIIIGANGVAVAAIGMQIVSIFRNVSASISSVFLPYITKLTALDAGNEKLTDIMIKVGRWQFLFLGLIITGFGLIGEDFIRLWVGEDYTEAYKIVMILGLSLIVPLSESIGINILEAKNLHGFRAWTYFAISMINVILTGPFIKMFGIIGGSISTSLSLIIGNVVIINLYYHYKIGLHINKVIQKVFLRMIPGASFSYLISYLAVESVNLKNSWIALALKALIISLIYSGIMATFGAPAEMKRQIYSKMNIIMNSYRHKRIVYVKK